MPPLGAILQGSNFATLAITLIPAEGEKAAVTINYGKFLQTVIDFILIAFVIFSIVKVKNRLMDAAAKREAEEQAAINAANHAPEPVVPVQTPQEQLLSEIRDLLKAQAPTKY
jgi:large conductance mechanosensitive channel